MTCTAAIFFIAEAPGEPRDIFLCLFPNWFWTTYFLRSFSHKIHQLIQIDTWGTASKFTHSLSDQAPLDSFTTGKFWLTLEERNDHSRRGCHDTVVHYLIMLGWVSEWRLKSSSQFNPCLPAKLCTLVGAASEVAPFSLQRCCPLVKALALRGWGGVGHFVSLLQVGVSFTHSRHITLAYTLRVGSGYSESFLGEKDFQTILKKERKLVFWREAWSAQTNLEQGQNIADTLSAQPVSPSDPTISVPSGCSKTTESCLAHPHSAGWMCWGD